MIFLKRRALMTRASFNYKTVSGIGSAVLENCVETKFKRLVLSGNSKQTTTKGINLLPFKVGEKIISSDEKCEAITKKDGVDITIKAGAVNDVKSDIYFIGNGNGLGGDESAYELFQEGDYTFINNTNNQLYLFVIAWRNGEKKTLISGSRVILNNFTINKNDKVRIFLRPSNTSQTYFLEKASVMLCKHTDTNLPYEPYTGGKPSPSVEYPQDIENTGMKGKNLFDISKLKSNMIPTENINIEENTITLPPGGAIYFNKLKDICNDLKNGDEVYLFAKTTGGRSFIGFFHESVSISSWNFNAKNTITENILNSALLLYSDTDLSVVVSDIMITKVNDKTYEPYLDKFLVDVSVTGKNLFDINSFPYKQDDETIVINSNQAYYGTILVKGDALRKKQYVISIESFENIGDNTSTVLLETVYKDGVKDERYLTSMPKKGWVLSSTREIDYIRIRNPWKAGSKIKKLQIEEGKEATEYEPYHEPQTVKIQLDEPLRGIGGYKDVVTKDGIVRNILQVRIADYIQNTIYGESGKKYLMVSTPNALMKYDRKRCMSNVGFTKNGEDILYIPVVYESNIKLNVSDDDTVETIREKVKDVVVAYTVKEPILEALPTELELALSNLYTNDGSTIISVDSGEVETGIEVEYAVKS